jgi:hypothetical protein
MFDRRYLRYRDARRSPEPRPGDRDYRTYPRQDRYRTTGPRESGVQPAMRRQRTVGGRAGKRDGRVS